VAAGTEYLYSRQRDDGAWTDRLSSSAIPTALGLLALARADRTGYRQRIETGLQWLRGNQLPDGGWSMSDDDPPSSPGASAFAVAALHELDPEGCAQCIENGMKFIDANDGDAVIPGMTGPGPRTWPAAAPIAWALVGLRDVEAQPYQPVEVMLLPSRLRNKVTIGLPAVLALGIMQSRVMHAGQLRRLAQRLAEPRALAWLRSAMGPNGGIEECPMLSALIYIGLHVADAGHDIQRKSLDYLLATQRPDGSWAIDRDLEIAVTGYAILALAESGDLSGAERLRPTRDWLLSTQWRVPFTPLKIPAGGWSWNVPSGWPECEDTAVVLTVLGELGMTADDEAVGTGLRWLRSRQNRNGSWSEWIRNSSLLNDRPCTGVTAHVVMALNRFGDPRTPRSPIGRALSYYQRIQQPDGATPSLWFRDSTHGTAKVLEAYADLGLAHDPVAAKARAWLLGNQRSDGAWPVTVQVGMPGGTAEETGWALYSLLRAGEPAWTPSISRAVEWLLASQDGGTWQPSPVGLYFEDLVYGDDLIAHTYALRALSRWVRCARKHDRRESRQSAS